MIYYFKDEVKILSDFFSTLTGIDPEKINSDIMQWLEKNKNTNKYITFEVVTSMGQDIFDLRYGKYAKSSDIKQKEVICHVSSLGIQFKDK